MSSTEIVLSPTKKTAKDQIVSNEGVTNGCDVLDNVECSNGDNDDESALITNPSETNKECPDDAGMEPLLIEQFSANEINETNSVLSNDDDNEAHDVDGGGGFIKSNLSLNLNELMKDDKNMPKNKKFLESSDDQIINQIFFSTITVTPTTDDDVLDSKFLSNDNTPLTPNEVDAELLEGPVDFFNRKIDEDETFDTTFTDATENYQENDGNLCSLNDNFNENYCSFSSVDYNPAGPQHHDEELSANPCELLQPESFLGNYGELMRQQRPSIVIDCYDSDSNSEKNSQTDDDANVVVGEAKINDYCFYFDQTIEEDDDDACYLNGAGDNSDEVHTSSLEDKIVATDEKDQDDEEVDECFETEDEIFNDEEALPNELDDESLASDEDDEGVINESCISVNSAVESLESETTVVKKSVKKSVKSSKTTTKKIGKTISTATTESSSVISSKAASFENSFSNGSVDVVEQHHVEEHHAVHQESVMSNKSIDSSTATASIQDSPESPVVENGEKKKLNGKRKSKKSKKSDEKENISVKSSFSKFDALQKKNMQNLQNGRGGEANGHNPELEKKCHACEKAVFQMEQVKAEKKFWHKNCFRCSECSKQLNVDTYQSHEGILYCKPHFKTLFAPKAVEDTNEPVKPRKLEMIIRESQPIELPPDVARSSDKADLGLEELQQLNVRQRFQVFENAGQQETRIELDKQSGVKRSTSILSKLARFQAKGMDVGVVDDSLNGICYEHSSSEEEDEEDNDDENQEDIELIRAKRAQKEKPMQFKEMNDIKSKFESGQLLQREERREERKQELQNIRSRLFLGKQEKMKEAYQQAVADSEQTITAAGKKSDFDVSDKAKSIKERFEKGEIFDDGDIKRTLKDDEFVFEQGIGKQSRSLFLELDASASKSPIQQSPSSANLNRQSSRQYSQTLVSNDDIVRSDAKVDDVQIETADIVSKFKFFETFKPEQREKKAFRITPPRDGVAKLPSPESDREPHVKSEEDELLELAGNEHTAQKMVSLFRQLEDRKEVRPVGPKPLKRFTPPPDGERRVAPNDDSGPEYSDSEEDEEECEEEESDGELDPNYVKSSHKNVDEFLKAAQSAERAKQLREKFEKWEKNEIKKEMNNSSVNLYEPTTDDGQMETAKSLRARFEQMQQEEPKLPNARVKVNRFV